MPQPERIRKRRSVRIGDLIAISHKKTPRKVGLEALIKGRKPSLIGVTRIMNDIKSYMKVIDISPIDVMGDQKRKLLRKVYSTKTAEDYLNMGFIPVQGTTIRGSLRASYGCHQQSMVLHKALEAIGMKPQLVRYIYKGTPHTTVIFAMNHKIYEADPFYGRIGIVKSHELKKRKRVPRRPISWERYIQQLDAEHV